MTKNNRLVKGIIFASQIWLLYLAVSGLFENFYFARAYFKNIWVAVILISLAALLVTLALFVWLSKRLPKKRWPAALIVFVLALCLKLAFAFMVNTPQYSDFQLFWWVTNFIAKGDTSYLTNSTYFSVWAYQAGFPMFMAPAVKIFGQSLTAVLSLNITFMALSNMLLYLILYRVTSPDRAMFAALLYMFLPLGYGLSPVYTNQHAALFFIMLAVYLLTAKSWKLRSGIALSAAAGLALAVSNAIRPEASIILIAVAATAVLTLISEFNDKLTWLKRTGSRAATAALSFFVCFALINSLVKASGFQPLGLVNNFPLYKFAVGLNHESYGRYNDGDAALAMEDKYAGDTEERDSRTAYMIKERLKVSPGKLLRLLHEKNMTMWSAKHNDQPAFSHVTADDVLDLGFTEVKYMNVAHLFMYFDGLYMSVIFILCIYGLAGKYGRGETNKVYLLGLLSFLGFCAVFLVIEVQMRYRLLPLTMLFLTIGFLQNPQDGLRRKSGTGERVT
ncbi:MAG: glycosyltransferase family 39 protein [Oscillospiraceae bacterium]|jgi:hypothetical protein|nr:glycosyltransferase family 39 protein [Oscillospiraceae bacterium]